MGSLFSRLKKGLSRSREGLSQMLPGRETKQLSEDDWMDIEDGLIMADCGAEIASTLIARARKSRDSFNALRGAMLETFPAQSPVTYPADGPFVLLVVGVNGTGKTTTIGKLATQFRSEGKKVLVG
ncbi:MAG: signal recognition particle receptor subunit alpha, partial [Mariprofundaceae bacterium]|nr:signal recognition particle receptor subunit alpha [Mariprofundaceae bacterium]